MSTARIFYLYMPGRRKSSRLRGSSFSGTITRSRAGKETILLLVYRQTERRAVESPHATERLVFFRDHYEIESGQGNDTASVPGGRQTDNAGPSKVLATERLVFFRDHYEIDGEACLFSDDKRWRGERAHYLSVATFFWSSFTIIALLNLIRQHHNNFCYLMSVFLNSGFGSKPCGDESH